MDLCPLLLTSVVGTVNNFVLQGLFSVLDVFIFFLFLFSFASHSPLSPSLSFSLFAVCISSPSSCLSPLLLLFPLSSSSPPLLLPLSCRQWW